jgi:hypothetical protein
MGTTPREDHIMNVQWGLFTSNAGTSFQGQSEAENAMRGQGYAIYMPANNDSYTVIGGNGNVIVQATFVPQGSGQYVVVTAYADDEPSAEQARNVIRSGIR